MKNKIKGKIIQTAKRLTVGIVRRLLNTATTRAKRPIHLHSSAAIRIWLAMVDRPLAGYNGIHWAPSSHSYGTAVDASPQRDTTRIHAGWGGASDEGLNEEGWYTVRNIFSKT